MSKTVIQVEGLSKQYRLGQVGRKTISHDFNRWWHQVRGKEDPYLKIGQENDRAIKGTSDYVWSLRDINFDVKEGAVLGIIGRNGAGKSTLLKILSKVTKPTLGEIKLRGRVASLLEVGTGFHPDLSGRKNIYLNGAILGMTTREIDRKFDEIVDFAGVERYIDTPVKRYSSGMYVRLAFAVAAHLEPEILIVDEVLAVGDAEFQKKCLGKMKDVSVKEGRTVLFVSHNMDAIKALCTTGLVLKNGLALHSGSVNDCLNVYLKETTLTEAANWQRSASKLGPHFTQVQSKLTGKQPQMKLLLTINCASDGASFPQAFMAIDIKNSLGVTIMQAIPELNPFIAFEKMQMKYNIEVEIFNLIPDRYYLSFWMGPHNTETYDFVEDAICFDIIESPLIGRIYPHTKDHGFLVPQSKILSSSF